MSYEGWDPGSSYDDASNVQRGRLTRDRWWLLNGTIRFYGLFLLIMTKTTDAVTTAIGLRYVPGIVELNPLADAVFAGGGTVAGLAVLSFATVGVAMLAAELLAIEIRRTLQMDCTALLAKAVVYGALSLLFGWVSVNNALLISEQVQQYFSEMLVLAA